MSDKNQETNEEILAHNVGELLRHGHEPPQIDAGASARILEALESKLEAQNESKDSAEPGRLSAFFSSLFASPLRAGLVAGAIAVAVVATGVVINRDGDRVATTAPFEPTDYTNEGVAPKQIELVDGSVMTLRAGASVRATAPRSIELRSGDVLFDVVKAKTPFTVSRPGSDHKVVVLGTRFVLESKKDSLMAAVIRGSVRLETKNGKLVLGAGEGGEAVGSAAPVRKPIPRLSHLVSWARGARARAEGTIKGPIRRGNLVARFAGREGLDYPLPVRNLGIDIHLEDEIARVAIDQTFFNEHPSQLEGLYSFSLPAGAAISRLAMYVNGELMEAGIAERDRARRVYESIVYRRRDPALMEWMAGNEVKVRIFPLFGRREKRILLSYTQSLERLYDDVQLTVPLPRLEDDVGVFTVGARLVGCAECEVASTSHAIETEKDGRDLVVRFNAKSFKVQDDLLLTVRKPASGARVVAKKVGDDHIIRAQVSPDLSSAARAEKRPRRWVLLHDTSGSRRELERAAQVHVIDRLLDELDETDEIAVVAFDATVRKLDDGAFVSVGNADRKATHDWVEEQGKGSVGFTDLASGLRTAAGMLADAPNAADYEPMIIYLGDGIATGGDRKSGELVSAVAGRAAVVAVAVGATHDDAALAALAGETGGLSVVLNPGQDLDWRVFDLVASLHGERVTDLRAEIDGTEAEVYASARQLAAGEEVSLVARVSGPLPSSFRLRGIRAGKPWSVEVPITSDAVTDGGGYLPRHWARKRIASLLDAEGLEDGADHKAEITSLALEHWLLTPYTSLLVLENDAAYKQYKVARSTMEGWAAYKVPKKIEVKVEPLTSGIDLAAADIGALVFRSPVAFFAEQQSYYYDGYNRHAGFDFATRGRWGGMAGGSGTGRGFGGAPAATPMGGWLALEGEERAQLSRRAGPAKVASSSRTTVLADDSGIAPREIITRNKGFRDNLAFSGNTALESGVLGNIRGDFDGDKTIAVPGRSFESVLLPEPTSLTWAGDARFNDLTSMLPAMFSTAMDRQRERLVREDRKKTAKSFAVDPDAAAMIEKARELAGRQRYRTTDVIIDVDSKGRFAVQRKTDMGLDERLHYDGERLVTDYSELDISVARDVGAAEPLLLETEVPMLMAKAENLARFYSISKIDDRSIALSKDKMKWKMVVRFDDRGRLKSLSRERGIISSEILRIDYGTDSVSVVFGESKVDFSVEAIADASVRAVGHTRSVNISLPLRHPGFVEAQLKTDKERKTQHQLAAVQAALGLFGKQGQLALEMAKDGPLSFGELVLLSAGISGLGANAGKALDASDKTMSVRRYIEASTRYARSRDASAFTALAKDESWIGSLALLREVMARVYNGTDSSSATAKLVRRLAERKQLPFAYLAAFTFDSYHRWRSPKAVTSAWLELAKTAEGTKWDIGSRIRLATAHSTAGQHELAVRQWEVVRNLSLETGRLPALNYTVSSAFRNSPRGEAGWQTFWGTTREMVLDSNSKTLMIGLLRASMSVGQQSDIARIASTIADQKLSTGERLTVVSLVRNSGHPDIAWRLFEPLAAAVKKGEDAEPTVLRMASSFAISRGEHLAGAELFHRALQTDDTDVPLTTIRSDYASLISMLTKGAQLAEENERGAIVERLIDASLEWRQLDPDNANLDSQVATSLFTVGEDIEAFRILSTAIERRPMEGTSFQVVATALERQGRVEEAIELWGRASTVEPENPTWVLNEARAHSALGHSDKAIELLDALLERKDWHERFIWIVQQAKQTRAQL